VASPVAAMPIAHFSILAPQPCVFFLHKFLCRKMLVGAAPTPSVMLRSWCCPYQDDCTQDCVGIKITDSFRCQRVSARFFWFFSSPTSLILSPWHGEQQTATATTKQSPTVTTTYLVAVGTKKLYQHNGKPQTASGATTSESCG
jgi:hypothetical protein